MSAAICAKPVDSTRAWPRSGKALAGYERKGRADAIRFVRWQVANVLRLRGRADEAQARAAALRKK